MQVQSLDRHEVGMGAARGVAETHVLGPDPLGRSGGCCGGCCCSGSSSGSVCSVELRQVSQMTVSTKALVILH